MNSPRRVGLNVDPERVRQARLDRGLSLAQLAGTDVSRAFIHQVERGHARPSRQVLELIARRTGKPMSYFTGLGNADVLVELQHGLSEVARMARRSMTTADLRPTDREALALVEVSLRQGGKLVRAITAELRSFS